MITTRAFLRCAPVALVACLVAVAPAGAQRPPAAGANPAATETFSFMVSYSDTARLERSGTSPGDVAVTALSLGVGSSTAVGPGYRLGYGVDYAHFNLDRGAGVPLPGALRELSVPLSLAGTLASDWQGRLLLRPGIYGSTLSLGGGRMNVPVLALASWRQSADLSWAFGLRYDAWARTELLPFAGVNWKFAPEWELAVGLPRTGVSWQFRPDTALRLGATVQGGSFHVAADPRPAGAAGPALGDTKLDYREIRVGAALDHSRGGTWTLLADAGVIVSQRFDYSRRHYRLSGDPAAYATLAVRGRF